MILQDSMQSAMKSVGKFVIIYLFCRIEESLQIRREGKYTINVFFNSRDRGAGTREGGLKEGGKERKRGRKEDIETKKR